MSNPPELAGLSSSQRELLLKRLNKANREKAVAQRPRIVRQPRNSDSFPLSFSQQRIWFFEQIAPGNVFFNIPAALRFAGPLNVGALEKSLSEIIRRHEVLRATFTIEDGNAVQKIAWQAPFHLEISNLQSLSAEEREREARRRASEDALKPFDLSTGPLLRAAVLKLAEDDHALLFTMHHIVSDAWSMGILMRELATLYEAFSKNQPSPLEELPLQYIDYAIWQRRWLQGETLERQIAYWKDQLKGITPLELPTDRPRPAIQTFQGAREFLALSPSFSQGVRALAQLEGVSLFVVLLAAFKAVLRRHARQDDIVVGSLIAGRNRVEVEVLIGFFVNALVMRTDLAGDPTFRELIGRVRRVALGAYAHQDLPLEKIVDELQPERDPSRHPLFQVHFVMQNAPREAVSMPDLSVRPQGLDSEVIRVDLEFHLWDGAEQIAGNLVYNTALFEPDTVKRMLGHFETLLRSAVGAPDRRLSQLQILTEAEQRQLVVELNETAAIFAADGCLHHAFEARAARNPNAIGLIMGEQTLNYGELNARANRLAHHLMDLGVGPEARVGISVERSPELVIGILGILKAGAAYVPIDPSYPAERAALMLGDARVLVLLTTSHLSVNFASQTARVLCLDTTRSLIAIQSAENPVGIVSGENLAYVIYTSGSTGNPKGVAICHSGAVNNLNDLNDRFGIGEGDRTLALSSMSFDMCVYDVLGTLSAGGTIVMPELAYARDPAHWAELIKQHQITIWNSAPSLLELLVNYVEDKPDLWPRSLATVMVGGDWVPVNLPGRLKAMAKNAKFAALGGATEASIHSTIYLVEEADPEWVSIPYGRPMRNQQTYVLDADLQVTPIGVAGELHLSGVGLARGYFNAPDLTAQKFIPSPIGDEPGKRIYKTGDLARYLPDGTIELLGRMDHQVKLRGYRIELGEVSHALRQVPGISEAIVMIREDEPGERRLVAYFVPHPGVELMTKDLRNFLKKSLPDYMIPSAFAPLAALPLSPNGKIDRRLLPSTGSMSRDEEVPYIGPRTPRETTLARIWAESLGAQQVGVHDNFFELGGDSILVIKVIHTANQEGFRLSPRDLFQHQTVAELAAVAEDRPLTIAEQGVLTGESPLTPSQHWFFEQNLAAEHHWNQAIMLEALQPVEPALISEALKHILSHHDALRLRFERAGAGWRQWHAVPGEPPFSSLDLSSVSEDRRIQTVNAKAEELQASLNLADGPVVRAAYFELGAGRPGRLLLVAHHLIIDSVSWGILLEDLQTAYRQLELGETPRLPLKTTSYQRWAQALVEQAQSPEIQSEAAYWVAEPRRHARPLQIDFTEGENLESSAATVSVSLSAEETITLLQQVPKTYATRINDALLTALSLAFTRQAGTPSLLVDLGGHGREDIFNGMDLSRTIGWFSFDYPVLIEINKSDSLERTINSVREQLRQVPRRGIGHGMLRYLSADPDIVRSLKAIPEAQIGFYYIGQVNQSLPSSFLFTPARDGRVSVHSPQARRRHLLDAFAEVRDNQLRCAWVYSRNHHHAATVERLAREFITALRQIIGQV
ncbi:MAG TPA: amino acid adenylation domain-containing protein [Blastocatellia bacterium]|nr:amino acid adenylation domain-containing protein [Blastocatellia bacterium]